MNRVLQVLCIAAGIPMVAFYCLMGIPVILFGLFGGIFGHPGNLIFVVWWVAGGYGIYCGVTGIIGLGRASWELSLREELGILLGIVALLAAVRLFNSGELWWGEFACLALVPGVFLLAASRLSKWVSRRSRGESQPTHGGDAGPARS